MVVLMQLVNYIIHLNDEQHVMPKEYGIHVAVWSNDYDKLLDCLKQGVDPNLKDESE